MTNTIMVDLLSSSNHILKKGDTLCLQNDTFLHGAFYKYRIKEIPEHVGFCTDQEKGDVNPPRRHRFIFEKSGTFVIQVTRLGYVPSDDIMHNVRVVVE
jgi:hypothetical protein